MKKQQKNVSTPAYLSENTAWTCTCERGQIQLEDKVCRGGKVLEQQRIQ